MCGSYLRSKGSSGSSSSFARAVYRRPRKIRHYCLNVADPFTTSVKAVIRAIELCLTTIHTRLQAQTVSYTQSIRRGVSYLPWSTSDTAVQQQSAYYCSNRINPSRERTYTNASDTTEAAAVAVTQQLTTANNLQEQAECTIKM
eukprot:12675-Heterococcus_DN1.PRE.3